MSVQGVHSLAFVPDAGRLWNPPKRAGCRWNPSKRAWRQEIEAGRRRPSKSFCREDWMLLQFNVIILRFLLVGMLNTLLLLFLLLLLLHFDVSMLAELFLFGLLAFSGLKVWGDRFKRDVMCKRLIIIWCI